MLAEDSGTLIEIRTSSKISERKWLTRTFSRLEYDSLRGSIFVMLLTALGTGVFALHHVFDRIGILPAYACIIVIGFFYFIASDILIFSFKTSPYSKSINELMRNILGPFFGLLYDLVFFVYLMLSLIAQILSISGAFFNNFSDHVWVWFDVPVADQNFEYFNFYFCIAAGFFLLFINIKQTIAEFRYFSLISFMIFVYVVCVCLAQTPLYYDDLVKKGKADFVLYDFDAGNFLSTYGLVLFAFNCLTNFYGVATTVSNPSVRRLRKIFSRTFIILTLLFIAFGSASYFSLGSKLSSGVELFIFRPPIAKSDMFMIVGRSLLILSFFVGTGLTFLPLKVMTLELMGLENDGLNNFMLTLIFTISTVAVAANFPGVPTYLSIAGSFSVTLIVFTFPGICGLKIEYVERKWLKILIGIWITTLTVMGFAGSYLSFMHFRKKNLDTA